MPYRSGPAQVNRRDVKSAERQSRGRSQTRLNAETRRFAEGRRERGQKRVFSSAFLRALCGPYRDVFFVPTGNITPALLPDYLALPQVLACGGSWMVKPELLRAGDFEAVRAMAEEATSLVGRSR